MDPLTPGAPEHRLVDDLARLTRERAARERIQELCLAFSRGVSATLAIGPALDTFCRDTNALFDTARVSVWLHHRRPRELVLTGSSDPSLALAPAQRVSTEDPTAAPARGLRLTGPLVVAEESRQVLVAPLRGWRRALGTVVIEGRAGGLDVEPLTALAVELSRQLSIGIENIQLLEEVLRQRRLLENTFNSIVDLVVVTDNALRVVQMNEAFAGRAGTSRAELLERPLTDLVGREMAEWITAGGAGDGARTREIDDQTLGGIYAATVTRLIDEDGEPVGHVLVARDISAQALLEAEREALRSRLAQSERLASLGQFVAGIAHEMNNPLQGVLGHLELLMETSAEAKPLRADLRRIYQEGERAAKIVRDLLVFTGSRRMARQRIRIDRVIARALTSRRAALGRAGIDVVRRVDASVPWVSGDALLLQQAFLNVLINAEHAIATRDGTRQIQIDIGPADDGAMVRTTIRDSGTGISNDVLPHIFDPFFTTKEVGQGIGLGLAITYGIVQEHGGVITAANTAEGGAAFTIDLPAAAAAARPSRTPGRARV